MIPNPSTVYVDRAYTERVNGPLWYTPRNGNVMSNNSLEQWACEELNLGPHAYQARRKKAGQRTLRALPSLPAACPSAERAESAPESAQARRQRVDSTRPRPLSLGGGNWKVTL